MMSFARMGVNEIKSSENRNLLTIQSFIIFFSGSPVCNSEIIYKFVFDKVCVRKFPGLPGRMRVSQHV